MTRGDAVKMGLGIVAALGVAAVVLLGPWWTRDLPIMEADVSADDRELTVLLGDACGLEPERAVVETDTEVRVHAWAKAPLVALWSTDCQVALTIGLAAPVGDRVLVDEATAGTIDVATGGAA
ncbi:hypothetical protein [Demequina rhizosphaerae]|uniref:hypothetical protein n=1 Tax=Demequina rhizosphaerae TaxID=1638985 RepID=UPI000A5EBB0A|nr:hypothetical protein [Demequina rhizosphaerae]